MRRAPLLHGLALAAVVAYCNATSSAQLAAQYRATLAEIERCAAMGHKGIVFTQDPSYFGLPQLTDLWGDAFDRAYRAAEAAEARRA